MDPSLREAQRFVTAALQDHSDELRGFVRARAPEAEVEDILQMAALRALERSETLHDPERVRSWLFAIHRNLVTDTLRRRASRERLMDAVEPQEPEVLAEDPCDCGAVQAARLRPGYATMLQMVDSGGASLSEAATALGITVNNATVRLHRARAALRKAMLEHCGVQNARDCLDCRCVFDGCCVA